jgi:hypothetical protein
LRRSDIWVVAATDDTGFATLNAVEVPVDVVGVVVVVDVAGAVDAEAVVAPDVALCVLESLLELPHAASPERMTNGRKFARRVMRN